MATVKVRRKRLKLRVVFLTLILLGLICYFGYYLFTNFIDTKINNIYVIGNEILKDYEVIELAKIENYPKILSISSSEMERRIKISPYVKSVEIKKKIGNEVYIYITEYKPLFYIKSTQKLVLEGNKELYSDEILNNIPILINDISDEDIYNKLIKKFSLIDDTIKSKISEINYIPNDVDKERFLLSMNDGNYVYITLPKIEEVNKYLEILPSLENKKGILYLDSGNYFEIIS